MYASYHNHTTRCYHAFGTDEEYVEAAVRAGYGIFGFSDHCPHPFAPPYVSRGRMEFSDLPEYVGAIRALGEKYKDSITVKAGLEVEYSDVFFERDIEGFREAGIEYLILGQHCLGSESYPDWMDAFALTNDKNTLVLHTDICIKALNSGKFSIIAHPDVMHYVGDEDFYLSEMDRLIRAAKRNCVPLEINLNGFFTNRHYPNPLFWRLVSEIGADAVLGVDAHSPARVYDKEELEQSYRFAEKYKLNVLDNIRFKVL